MSISKRGGKRPGAGRKNGSGLFKEKTIPIRIPLSKEYEVRQLIAPYSIDAYLKKGSLQLVEQTVSAGTPFSLDQETVIPFDVHTYITQGHSNLMCYPVGGDSMRDAGIFDQDIVIVTLCKEFRSGDIIIARLNGALTLKRILIEQDQYILRAENIDVSDIYISTHNMNNANMDTLVIDCVGIVIGVIRRLKHSGVL